MINEKSNSLGDFMKMASNVKRINSAFSSKRVMTVSVMALTLIMPLSLAVTACDIQKKIPTVLGSNNMKIRFEDYEKAEDAQKKLLELYPVGSDYKIVADTFKSANRMFCLRTEEVASLDCEYLIPTSKYSSIAWFISIFESAGKIAKIEVSRTFSSI